MAIAPWRDLINAPPSIYIPSDTSNFYANDWAMLTGTLRDATYGLDTLDVSIGGIERIGSGGTGTFAAVLPDADAAHDIGAGGTRWNNVYGVTFTGSGTGLTGVLLLAGGTMSGAINMGTTNKINSMADATNPQDAATLANVTAAIAAYSPMSPLTIGTSGIIKEASPASDTIDMRDAADTNFATVRAGQYELWDAATKEAVWTYNQLFVASDFQLIWNNTTDIAASAPDLTLERGGVSQLDITDGGAGLARVNAEDYLVGAGALIKESAGVLYLRNTADTSPSGLRTGTTYFDASGTIRAILNAASGLQLNNAMHVRWGPNLAAGSDDVGFYRESAGLLRLSDGGAGLGNLYVGDILFDGLDLALVRTGVSEMEVQDGSGGLGDLTVGALTADSFDGVPFSVSSSAASKLEDGFATLLGAYIAGATGQTISSGSNPTMADMGRLHVTLNITAVGTAGTVRITGTSYDKTDGTETPADTEDIAVGAGLTGWYKSSKYWTGTVTLSGLTTTSVTADLSKYEGWHPPGTHDLTSASWQWFPISVSNGLEVSLYRFDFATRTRDLVMGITETNTTSGEVRQYARSFAAGAEPFDFDGGDRLVLEITDATKIAGFGFSLTFS